MKTLNTGLLIFQVLLVAASCSGTEKEATEKDIATAKRLRALERNCYDQINIDLTGLLTSSEALKEKLNLSDGEAMIITNPQKKPVKPQLKAEVIEKLIPLITDTTCLEIYCEHVKLKCARLGDLALLCIYQVEEFPFAMALSRQWCTGGSFSKNIFLPHNLIAYTNFERGLIKESYIAYYHGAERIQHLKAIDEDQ